MIAFFKHVFFHSCNQLRGSLGLSGTGIKRWSNHSPCLEEPLGESGTNKLTLAVVISVKNEEFSGWGFYFRQYDKLDIYRKMSSKAV